MFKVATYFSNFFHLIFFITVSNFFIFAANGASQADMVIFSYNRPMQLYALLESVTLYCKGLGHIQVIYRADDAFITGYDEVKKTFSQVIFTKQGANPAQDFKPLTLSATFNSPNQYVVFAVDDIMVKDFCDFSDMIATVETVRRSQRVDVYGVYLRMGQNFTECYSERTGQKMPSHTQIKQDMFLWRFADGQHDWHYPNTVDMTLYRKKDIEADLRAMAYENPNKLEGNWADRGHKVMKKYGIFFNYSKMVNVPLNRVQQVWQNRTMNLLTPEELQEQFERGFKIDIRPLFQIKNVAAHMEYTPTFVPRDEYIVKGFACCV
jgi:hypothetical protein